MTSTGMKATEKRWVARNPIAFTQEKGLRLQDPDRELQGGTRTGWARAETPPDMTTLLTCTTFLPVG